VKLRRDAGSSFAIVLDPSLLEGGRVSGAREMRGAAQIGAVDLPARGMRMTFEFTDTEEQAILELANGALNHLLGHTAEDAGATVTLTRSALDRVILGEKTLADEVGSGEITVEPNTAPLEQLVSLFDTFEFWFPIVEP
jgi:alkyl sulfatase BDS1-like metallo-beta-lactamase superfamily hydrolase